MNPPQPIVFSYKDRVQEALDQLRKGIEAENPNEAAKQIAKIESLIRDWQRTINIDAAKTWLDATLQDEILLFNVDIAQQHLKQWESVLKDNEERSEFEQYSKRVSDQIKRKQRILEVRGVIAHCDELFAKAAELERYDAPPKPDFILINYYEKALAIAKAAKSDNEKDTELDMLIQRAERTHNDKIIAGRVYKTALEEARYTVVMSDLDALPDDMLIPRFILVETTSGKQQLSFHSMISVPAAKTELEAAATVWAEEQARVAALEAQQNLHNHHPQGALDALLMMDTYISFLPKEAQTQIQQLRSQAQTEQSNFEKAEKLCEQALQAASDDPLGSWNIYVEAYNAYQWAPSLNTTRQAVVTGLNEQLQDIVHQAESAFNNKNMERVRQIVQNGRYIYINKDDALNPLLHRLEELDVSSKQYEEYVQNATDTLTQVRGLIWKDPLAANDLLSQVESYPDMILESFPDLHQVRANVNERLNAENIYNQLYTQLYAEDVGEAKNAVESAKDAQEEYADDDRFGTLAHALEIHLVFLNAQQHRANGKLEKAVELFQQVAAADNHPDQNDANEILETLASGDQPVE